MRTVPAIAAVIAALCSAQAALAQDSQYPPVPFYDWTGVYVGANIGYGSATINDTTTSGGASTNSSQRRRGFFGAGGTTPSNSTRRLRSGRRDDDDRAT